MSKDDIIEDSFSSDEDFDDDDESESSTDVDAKLAEDDVFDVEFLKCYSALKKKDHKIYDPNVRFFTEKDSEQEDEGQGQPSDRETAKKSMVPKMTLLDLQLNSSRDGDEEHAIANTKIDLNQQVSKSYYEKELEEIKKSIEKVSEEVDSQSDDDLLVVKGSDGEFAGKKRGKINSILDKIENEDDEDIQHLKQVWTNPGNLSEEDKYLRDYILNKRYLGNTANGNEDDAGDGFFSKNLEAMSDADSGDDDKHETKSASAAHRSEEKDFDKIVRIPRNSTKTIRDLVEKQEKKERRMKKLEKEKKRKKSLKDADCEDIIGDLPTKFHYRETEPNDYGLTAEELLMATDEELDQWISLHECVAYRTDEQERALKQKFEAKRYDMDLKRKIFKSIYGDQDCEQEPKEPSKSKKRRTRKRKRNTDSESSLPDAGDEKDGGKTVEKLKKSQEGLSNNQLKKKKRRRGLNHKKFAAVGVAPDRLLAYGLSKTKLKKSKIM